MLFSNHKKTNCNHLSWARACTNVIVSKMKMATLNVKHNKHLMSKWTKRGGGNTHKQRRFFHREEVATVRICGHHYWLSFAEFDNIAASGHMMLVAVQVPMCQCANAMHWLPKWPPTCRRKNLGPRFDHILAAKYFFKITGKAQPR